jgi:hypothetical protein
VRLAGVTLSNLSPMVAPGAEAAPPQLSLAI